MKVTLSCRSTYFLVKLYYNFSEVSDGSGCRSTYFLVKLY